MITIDKDLRDEVFYPSGYVDWVINISEGVATTNIDGRSRRLPQVEAGSLADQVGALDRFLVDKLKKDCGYYDQAHFIKEFRKFTGITPFAARASLSTGGEDFQQAVNIGF